MVAQAGVVQCSAAGVALEEEVGGGDVGAEEGEERCVPAESSSMKEGQVLSIADQKALCKSV